MDFTKKSCKDFVEVLASKEPVPGGGGASALVGAIGMALGNMVGSLTLGKKKYASVEQTISELKRKADALQEDLLELVVKDTEVFEPLSRAYGMPTGTIEQQAKKSEVMEKCLRECCDVPLQIMEKCSEAIKLQGEFATSGTKIAISDVGCGVVCCKAAMQAASLNVFINTKAMLNREYASEMNKRTYALLDEYTELADEIYRDVAARFN